MLKKALEASLQQAFISAFFIFIRLFINSLLAFQAQRNSRN